MNLRLVDKTLVLTIAAACASKAPSPTPAAQTPPPPALNHQMCWLSTKDFKTFDLSEPRKHTRPPVVDKHEVSAIGIRMDSNHQALGIGVWLEKEDAAFEIQVKEENRSDVTKQEIPVNRDGSRVLKIDSTKAKRTSELTWIWQGEIHPKNLKKPKQHVFLFCARET